MLVKKFSRYLFCILLVISNTAGANNLILDAKTCFSGPFESHQSWMAVLKKNKKNFNSEQFLARFPEQTFKQIKQNLDCIDFTYTVGGLTVEGYYLKPKNAPAQSLPVVIYNRGGNARYGYVNFGQKIGFIADIAQDGYLVIGSQYRGASGRKIKNNGQDEFGGKDVEDVLALQDIIKQIPAADPDKVALVGWSRGVMQSYIAAQSMPKIKTMIAIAGNADVEKALAWRPAMEKVYASRVPDFANNRQAALEHRSVIKWLDKLPANKPILLVHGDKDKRVNVEQSKLFASALQRREHPHKLVIYAGDNHGLFASRDKLRDEVSEWLETYLRN
ncbi:prolyl oligopeptidase family serine peptidase [Aliiglaciecola sp. LCG003]|uniref:alpha/beta hydrolase family protein n=1 Tax=Aliiglaciecola sp. LCG003 TaxID=3053655 RepID=UPI002574448E|nr:prolyl oligopeptidase family serine peptidase [Aliiglaciecola sp. LCG003]WJG07842.1 prolyl oligopeptidase family serine peptidase [Aliiglaciecola sp. LCG003]